MSTAVAAPRCQGCGSTEPGERRHLGVGDEVVELCEACHVLMHAARLDKAASDQGASRQDVFIAAHGLAKSLVPVEEWGKGGPQSTAFSIEAMIERASQIMQAWHSQGVPVESEAKGMLVELDGCAECGSTTEALHEHREHRLGWVRVCRPCQIILLGRRVADLCRSRDGVYNKLQLAASPGAARTLIATAAGRFGQSINKVRPGSRINWEQAKDLVDIAFEVADRAEEQGRGELLRGAAAEARAALEKARDKGKEHSKAQAKADKVAVKYLRKHWRPSA